MVEQYLDSVVSTNEISVEPMELTPLVKELSGILNVSDDFDYKKDFLKSSY